MTYTEISKQIEYLSYRDKLRLAQLLVQLARKEEEEQNPEKKRNSGILRCVRPRAYSVCCRKTQEVETLKEGNAA